MEVIYNRIFLEHKTENLPENAERLISLGDLKEQKIESGEQYLSLVHELHYIRYIREISAAPTEVFDPDIEVSPASYKVAYFAVGATIIASQTGDFALVRPPGHHADRSHAAGFCLFNNIAIAVQKLVNEGKKVAILDIDGHHGNGTQNIFYNSNKVLYCSIHQSPAYPGTGRVAEVGGGEGRGYNLNVPVASGSGDDIFLEALKFLAQEIKKFKPDVVGVSAGFDGLCEDPLLNLNYSLHSYFECGQMLAQNFKKVFACLEGGYHQHLRECLGAFLAGINGKKLELSEEKTKSSPACQGVLKENISQLEKLLAQIP